MYEYASGDPVNFVDLDGAYAVPVARLVILGTIGAVSSGLGTYIEQNRSHSNLNWTTIGTSAAVGFVSGALTPNFGRTFFGLATLGGVSNAGLAVLNTVLGQNACQDPFLVQAVDSFVLGFAAGFVGGLVGGRYVRADAARRILFHPRVGSSHANSAIVANLNWAFEKQANVSWRGFFGGVAGAWTTNAPFSPFRAIFTGVDPLKPNGI